jgi:hypothetical protein
VIEMSALESLVAFVVIMGAVALIFALGYKLGADSKARMRDARGRFIKREQ